MKNLMAASRARRLCLVALGAAFFVSGCAVYDQLVEPAAGVVARGIDKACEHGMTPLAIEARRDIVAEINGKTTIGNHTPSDCDNDGLPDFEIDAEGIPVPVSSLPQDPDPGGAAVFAALFQPAGLAAPEVAAVEVDYGLWRA